MSFEVTTIHGSLIVSWFASISLRREFSPSHEDDGHRVRDNRRAPAVADQADLLFREGRDGDRSLYSAER